MQSDSYSPTDQLTTEYPSNRYSVLCYSSHSTLLRTSTSSHSLPTDHIGQHWPYHMLHAVRRIFPDRPFNRRKPIKPPLRTVLLKPLYNITYFYLISLSPDWPHRSILTIPYVACSQTHIPRPTIQPPKTHQTATQYCATRSTLQHYVLLPHLSISRLTISVNIDHTICCMLSDAYSPTDLLTTENPSNRHSDTMLLKPLYNITYFYLISLSPDWPYRSTLTIPYVVCSQTHILRPTS